MIWFTEGARALRALLREREREHLLPTSDDLYLCPLCIAVLFTIDELKEKDPKLTDEHAPPEWSGGKRLALTCRSCNNQAGSRFDGEAHKQDFMRRLVAGKSGDPFKVAYTVDGVTNYGNMHMSGTTGMLLIGVPAANNRADVNRMTEILDSYASPDATDTLSFLIQPRMRFDRNRARVSWIRAAYIVAFARFGWRYILQPTLDPLRAQLQNPDKITLPVLSLWDPTADPQRREVWVVKEPVELRSVMVVYGGHQVFLPVLNDSRTLIELSQAIVGRRDISQPARMSIVGDSYTWPLKPSYSFDPV